MGAANAKKTTDLPAFSVRAIPPPTVKGEDPPVNCVLRFAGGRGSKAPRPPASFSFLEGDLARDHRVGRRGLLLRDRQPGVAVLLRAVAARNRDIELGIAPHAVLVHVEALRLDFRRDADSPDLVHDPERAE